jgi:mono/diheme cytochrome c family protein
VLDYIYQSVSAWGYPHPLHPALTHMPIGLVVGALVLSVCAIILHRPALTKAAWYCGNIALVFAIPTIALGIADWQHFFAGGPVPGIPTKIILASSLVATLTISLVAGITATAAFRLIGPAVFFIATGLVVGLGYIGGNLVYGGRTAAAPAEYAAGEKIFLSNCAGCHAGGGNIIKPTLPLLGAPQLTSQAAFAAFIRQPHMPDGAGGTMPGFGTARISDNDAIELYAYIVQVLATPRTSSPTGP